MSSMTRTIQRGMARKNGTFTAQKPLREKNHVSIKDMLLRALRGMEIQRKAKRQPKEEV